MFHQLRIFRDNSWQVICLAKYSFLPFSPFPPWWAAPRSRSGGARCGQAAPVPSSCSPSSCTLPSCSGTTRWSSTPWGRASLLKPPAWRRQGNDTGGTVAPAPPAATDWSWSGISSSWPPHHPLNKKEKPWEPMNNIKATVWTFFRPVIRTCGTRSQTHGI